MPFSSYSIRWQPGEPAPRPAPGLRLSVAALLVGMIFLIPTRGQAEMLTGTILSIDSNGRQVTLRLDNEPVPRTLLVMVTGPLPACARPGNIIRVWGTFAPGAKYFSATGIRGPGHGARNDPTGVRFRLERSMGRGYRHPGRTLCPRGRIR